MPAAPELHSLKEQCTGALLIGTPLTARVPDDLICTVQHGDFAVNFVKKQ